MTDTPAPVAPAVEPAPPVRVVRFGSKSVLLNMNGQIRAEYIQTLTEYETFEDCLNPDSYKTVMAQSSKPKRQDKVCVYSHDGRDYREFLVIAADKTWLKMQPLMESKSVKSEAVAAPALDIKWNVGKRHYQVTSKEDNSVLKDGFQLKEDAAKWANDHTKQMAA